MISSRRSLQLDGRNEVLHFCLGELVLRSGILNVVAGATRLHAALASALA